MSRLLLGSFSVLFALVGMQGCRSTDSIGSDPDLARVQLAEVLHLERAVRFEERAFRTALGAKVERLRSAAARSLGRIKDARAVPLLREAAADHPLQVDLLSEIAFALGQIASEDAQPTLFEMVGDTSPPTVRRRATEALGKLKSSESSASSINPIDQRLSVLLGDSDATVRGEAALGLWRRDAKGFVGALVEATEKEADPEARWRMVHALARIDDPATTAPLRRLLNDVHPWVSCFAALGLRTPIDLESVDAISTMLAEPRTNWMARVEGLRTLGAFLKEADPELRDRIRDLLLEQLFRESNALAVETLVAALPAAKSEVVAEVLLATARGSGSPTVRRAATEAYGEAANEQAVPFLSTLVETADVWQRAAAARGLEHGKDAARAPLLQFLEDEDSRPREAAVRSLAAIGTEADWNRIQQVAVTDPSLAVRGTVVEMLSEHKPRDWQDTLRKVFEGSSAPEFWEVRTTILKSLAAGPDGDASPTRNATEFERAHALAKTLARECLKDRFVSVRRVAARILGEPSAAVDTTFEASFELLDPALLRRPPSHPRLIIETDRGKIVIELYLEDAPLHVSNIVDLARRGFYDGLLFHRVVPSFVVQGGDPRGDGWGDAGGYLPDEINPRLYLRGAVGMPKTAERDTGGCQIFITHLPTPTLDGRYTVFGRVVLGMEVVDRIEVGNRIVRARVQENRFSDREPTQ